MSAETVVALCRKGDSENQCMEAATHVVVERGPHKLFASGAGLLCTVHTAEAEKIGAFAMPLPLFGEGVEQLLQALRI